MRPTAAENQCYWPRAIWIGSVYMGRRALEVGEPMLWLMYNRLTRRQN